METPLEVCTREEQRVVILFVGIEGQKPADILRKISALQLSAAGFRIVRAKLRLSFDSPSNKRVEAS